MLQTTSVSEHIDKSVIIKEKHQRMSNKAVDGLWKHLPLVAVTDYGPLETFPLCLCSLQFVSLFARAVNICSVRDLKSTKLFSEYVVVVAFVCVS